MELDRRDFLKLLGLAGGTAGGLSLGHEGLETLWAAVADSEREWPGPGVETWVTSTCQQCPGGCGIRVRLLDGWPVRIEGNPFHPINAGGLCPKGFSGLQVLYDPDRIRRPLKRAGARGDGKWQEVGWDEAIQAVAAKLKEIREQSGPHRLVAIGGQYRGLMRHLWGRFLEAYGSPNYISTAAGCEASAKVLHLTQGIQGYVAYDLPNANHVLSFGSSLLEAGWSPVWQAGAYGRLRGAHPGHRVRIVQVDARLSMTAAKADEWIPIHPGTDGALALGIAHVLVKEKLYAARFVKEHAFGFEDWMDEVGRQHRGFKTLVLEEYAPDAVSQTTGVPKQTIRRLARDFAELKPSIAIAARGVSNYTNGLYNCWAVHCLNALAGSIDVPGGILIPKEVPPARRPSVEKDAAARKGLSMPRVDRAGSAELPLAGSALHTLPEAILEEKPYRIEALLFYYANPVFSSPDPAAFYKALEKVPFVVSFSPFMDEVTEYSDFVLPDHTYLERWQDDPTPPTLGHPVLSIRRPVMKPFYETQHTGDVLIKLAKGVGGSVAQAFPWEDFESLLKESVKGVYESRRGILAESLDEPWYQTFKQMGTWPPPPKSFDEFWELLLERGGWWDPDYRFGEWGRVFKTPSGKFEFYSQRLRGVLEDLAGKEASKKGTDLSSELERILRNLKVEARGDTVFLPHHESPRFVGDDKEFPFHLNTYKPMPLAGGRGAQQPFLQERVGMHVQVQWDSWVEINPATARKLGISDGDWVWIESPHGKIKVKVKLYPGAMPNVVNMPYGLGHTAYGRWAKGRGVNPNKVIGKEYDSLGGSLAYGSTRVKIFKA